MRLRSTQFVFLLLLACSVQVREDYALRLTAAAVSESARFAFQASGIASASVQSAPQTSHTLALSPQAVGLDPAARAAHRMIWFMRCPAAQSAAVVSFTGFLRA